MFFRGYWVEVSGYLHASATLPPDKKPTRYPLNRRVSETYFRSRFGRCGDKYLAPAGNERRSLSRPARRLVIITH
jgi:hypothetical protein